MVYDVVFSERASSKLTDILSYIEREWSLKIANEFTLKLNEKISYLIENPYIYQAFKNEKNVRRCVITEQVSLFYRIINNEVQIITLFDNRQNPQKLKI